MAQLTQQPTIEPLPKPAPGTAPRRVRVKRDWLRVRDAPTMQGSRVLLELPGGTELIVLEERDGWLRVAR
ncbi:MAG: hypothetical protein ACRDGG_00540, partial [Anaerolineae bacterium]